MKSTKVQTLSESHAIQSTFRAEVKPLVNTEQLYNGI